MPMEEYHRLDILSAITNTIEAHNDHFDEIRLEFTPTTNVNLNYWRTPKRLTLQFSDYLDVDGVPSSLFVTVVNDALYKEFKKFDARTKEFLQSSSFLNTKRPIFLERNKVTEYLGTYGGLPVWRAGIYHDILTSKCFGCILVRDDLTLEDLKREYYRRYIEPLWNALEVPHEMRNVAICD